MANKSTKTTLSITPVEAVLSNIIRDGFDDIFTDAPECARAVFKFQMKLQYACLLLRKDTNIADTSMDEFVQCKLMEQFGHPRQINVRVSIDVDEHFTFQTKKNYLTAEDAEEEANRLAETIQSGISSALEEEFEHVLPGRAVHADITVEAEVEDDSKEL